MILQRTSGILIPRELEEEPYYQLIKKGLTRYSKDFLGKSTTILNFYVEGPKFLKLPRFFPIEMYIPDCSVENKYSNGEDIEITHKITPRDDLQKSMIDYLLHHENGLIQAPPGSGKTVVAINTIAERKKKALILVHKKTLVDQWCDDFLEFTNLDEKDIMKLTSKNYNKALKSKIIVTTNQTFTSLLKRDRLNFLKALSEANIGILFADEVHTSVGAPTFSECSIHLPIKYVYGLSATPYRYDKNEDIIICHLGKIFIPEGKESTMPAKVTVLLFSYGILSSKTAKYIYWDGEFSKARYLKMIRKSKMLNQMSSTLLKRLAEQGRKIIYVADRIQFLEERFSQFQGDKSKFIGSAKNDVLKSQVVFATTQKIRDGVDCVDKDCLVMTSPVGNIEQLSGRIVRISKDKKQPIIIDMVDIDDPNISRSLINRIDYYNSKNWEINYLFIEQNGKSQPKTKDEVRKMIKGEDS